MAYDLLIQAWPQLSWSFLISAPLDAGRNGGIAPLLLSTALILVVCLGVTLPVGLACALYLSEMVPTQSAQNAFIGKVLDVLSAIPSIVFGLFGYAFFAHALGLGFSILSGGLTLACMVLPLFVRLSEHALRATPNAYRQAAGALDISQTSYIWRILLPTAANGLAAAIIVSIGRALAETAVLIFTAGYVTRTPESLLDSGRSLSVHIYDLAMNVPGGSASAAATALVLMAILVILNVTARLLLRQWQHRQLQYN